MDKVTSSFLSQASQHLLATSPSTSAHLSLSNIDLRRAQGLQVAANACQSCGTLSIPGRTSSLRSISSRGGLRKGQSSARHSTSQVWAFRCNACGRDTHVKPMSSKPPSARIQKTVVESQATMSNLPERRSAQQSTTQEPKLSSKKRARARNDRSSLQALLGNSRTSSATPKLSFGDLMKR